MEAFAMRPTTITSMVQGMGAFIDQDNLKAPKDLMQLGVVMRNGRPQRIERRRTLGGVDGTAWGVCAVDIKGQ